jgi:hypothetical protein
VAAALLPYSSIALAPIDVHCHRDPATVDLGSSIGRLGASGAAEKRGLLAGPAIHSYLKLVSRGRVMAEGDKAAERSKNRKTVGEKKVRRGRRVGRRVGRRLIE